VRRLQRRLERLEDLRSDARLDGALEKVSHELARMRERAYREEIERLELRLRELFEAQNESA